jgi:hypothetical protein
MADIREAARRMQDGEQVRRASERTLGYVYRMRQEDYFPEMKTFTGDWVEEYIFNIDDLLAEDWESC